MSSSSDADERTLREIYFPAFETAVKREQPWTVMCSYNRLNGVFASENPWLLTNVLRKEWGFQGFVVSDWGAVSDRVAGIAAGLDLEMPASNGHNDRKIVEAVKEGRLDERLVDQACERILNIVYRFLKNSRPDTPWDREAQHLLSARIAAESMVLLKNEGDVLPLSREDRIAFIGEFAQKPRFQGGGSSHINSFKTTSALEAAAGLNVTFAPGYSGSETSDDMIAQAVSAAKAADVAVVFAGLPDSYESEGYDRTHMAMPDAQNRLIQAVAAANPRTVVVLHNGSPVEMPWIDQVPAVLEAYLGGQAVGLATVQVLFGEVNPSGHLPESFPKKLSDNPSYLFYGGEGNTAEYREGIFVGYRYYDKKDMDVLFPFGHGLSYTTFAYSDLRLNAEKTALAEGDTVSLTVTVKNTGRRFGKTVAQVYVGAAAQDPIRPVRELRAFEKVALNPGEEKQVSFTLPKRAFSMWKEDLHDWYVPAGQYIIEVGDSSRHLPLRAEITLRDTRDLPRHYDENTIFLDLMQDPRAMAVLNPYMQKIMGALGAGDENQSEAARDAITLEMNLAMMKYMPLRALLSFSGDTVRPEMIRDLLQALNAQ